MKQNDWTSQLRQRLTDSKAPVPDDLWNRIEQQLESNQATSPATTPVTTPDTDTKSRHQGAAMRLVMWTASVAAAVTLLVVIGYRANEDTITQLASTTNNTKDYTAFHNAKDYTGNQETNKAIAMANNSNTTAANNIDVESITAMNSDSQVDVCENDINEVGKNADIADNNASTTQQHYQESNSSQSSQPSQPRKSPNSQASAMWTTANAKPETTNRITLGIHTGGTFSNNNDATFHGVRAVRTSLSSTNNNSYNNDGQHSEYHINGNAMLLSNYKEVKHHAQPLTIGISVGYALNKRLALTSGLVYTRAETDFIKSSGNDDIVETQKLHYIGIPLNLKYQIWGNDRLQTYATAGGEADFNIKASIYAGGLKTDASHDRVQFSANTALGIQLNALPQVGIYAEPGVKYYFNNNSSVETIFKDKPWAFSLQMGVRVDF